MGLYYFCCCKKLAQILSLLRRFNFLCSWGSSWGPNTGIGGATLFFFFNNLFLTVLEAGRSKIKVLADPVSGEGPLPGLPMVVLLYPHMIGSKEREQALLYHLYLLLFLGHTAWRVGS